MGNLKPFKGVVRDISEKYGVPEETVEAIIVEWLGVLYYAATGRNPDDSFHFEI